ncbi:MAG: AI-2E family transporter [Bacteroidetes bacterium]|nr:AI-2E family transporter [Bacteroidota bacterium]
MHLHLQKTFYAIAIIFALFAFLIFAKTILIPLGMALLISFILFPVAKKFESWGMNEIIAASLSMLSLAVIIAGLIFFFSTQIMQLTDEFTAFREKITELLTDVILFINKNVSFAQDLNREDLLSQMQEWLKNSSGTLVGKTFNNTTTFLTQLLATVVYTFLILIYRNGLTKAIVRFYPKERRGQTRKMLKRVQEVGQKYLSGMLILIVILGFANSIGLWIIGIDSPFLFGFMAAVLSIIPYVGTTIGASIPVLYAFMSHDSLWVPFSVVILFWSIQVIESNFLNPKIVGSSIQVNALAAILSLIIGASVWGVAGMILFLPFTAMLKVVCDQYEELHPIAMLIGSENYSSENTRNRPIVKWVKKLKDRIINKIKNS